MVEKHGRAKMNRSLLPGSRENRNVWKQNAFKVMTSATGLPQTGPTS